MNQFKILIIEDDIILSQELKILLQNHSYHAEYILDFANVPEEVRHFEPNLILLDVNLPEKSGFLLGSEIRSQSNVPIVFVTSRNSDMDELNSIMSGGDAFITKPYNTAVLLARISSLLKRTYPSEQNSRIEHRGVTLFLDNNHLSYRDQVAELTKNEFIIMLYLFRNSEKICSRTEIIEFLWDENSYIDDNTLSVNITRIREKLKSIGADGFIITKHRQGYLI